LAGGWLGLPTLALPSFFIFWLVLYRVSQYILPLEPANGRTDAFRSLITFMMGTNYPYFLVRNGTAETRVNGSAFSELLAGPGIILADCDQAAFIATSTAVADIHGPGLHFTGPWEWNLGALDLRSQYHELEVRALTQDAIPVRVRVALAARMRAGGRPAPFPFLHRAVHQMLSEELIGDWGREGDSGQRQGWGGLIRRVLVPIVQDVLGEYRIDHLCASPGAVAGPTANACAEIARRIRIRLMRELWAHWIELIDCRIGNVVPSDSKVVARRLDNWRTEYEQQILALMQEGQASRSRLIAAARTEAELEIVLRLIQVVGRSNLSDEAAQIALALRFIDCLGEMVGESEPQGPLPASLQETLSQLRGAIGGDDD
jgi:hypothetical protein